MPVSLDLFSEPYSPSGNVAADGVRKLLGAPRLDLLQTLVREAVQNSCDAAKNGQGPVVRFRLRRLTDDQRTLLAENVLDELPDHAETSDPVRLFLESESPWALEICDFHTTGLGGPTRADVPPADGERTDFVDFVRNVGSKRDTELGGGTYGYGKSALYVASRCGLIVIDSETTCAGVPARRLIGAQLGEAYDAEAGDRLRRFTGRHWWGRLDDSNDFVDPLEGEEAAELAQALGLPERDSRSTGTSIMIVDPQFVADNVPDVIGALKEALLWYFWPRMMRDVPRERRLEVSIELDGEEIEVPVPEETPPLDLFCGAMSGIRMNDSSVSLVESQRPAAVLGRLNIVKGFRGDRIPMRLGEDTLFPQTSRHIAVMRPVELVVRYYEGDALPQDGFEWAGVFVTSSQPEIERAFADSEPPAHDDWQPEMLPPGWGRRYVRVALKRIREAAVSVAGGLAHGDAGHREGPSLAHIADIFGKALGSANRQGGAPRSRGSGPGGGGRSRPFSVSRPVFERLKEEDGRTVAVFRADIRNEEGAVLRLMLEPSLVIDGGSASPADFQPPVVVDVTDPDGYLLGEGADIRLDDHIGPLFVSVQMPPDGAVTLKASLELAASS